MQMLPPRTEYLKCRSLTMDIIWFVGVFFVVELQTARKGFSLAFFGPYFVTKTGICMTINYRPIWKPNQRMSFFVSRIVEVSMKKIPL